ncbi:MAG: hypothetical protein Q7S01_03030 [bacterium]|nr:hypothetical protein [bacterium]
MNDDKKLDDILKERLASLPLPVRNAITSADVEKGLRELADKHKLHLDQWETLENAVMLTLIGFKKIADLSENIEKEVGVDAETARAIASDITVIVFEPIRKELERELGEPVTEEVGETTTVAEEPAPVEKPIAEKPVSSESILNTEYRIPNTIPAREIIDNLPPRPIEVKPANQPAAGNPQPVVREAASIQNTEYRIPNTSPSTPPPAPLMAKSVRAVPSPAYALDTKSHERTAIDDDPYRESIA